MVIEKTSQFALTKDQFKMLQQLLIQNHQAKRNDLISSSCNVVHTSNPSALSIQSLEKGLWIVDSWVSDHMTRSSQFFSSYTPCPSNYKVRIADGSLSTVAGKGTVKLLDCLYLFSVLHVPNLKCNLLSVSKLTKDTNCVAKFCGSKCLF